MTTTTPATSVPTTTTSRALAGPAGRLRSWPARSWLSALALLGSALLGGACTHTHLSPNYGLSFNAWFTAQHVRHEPADSEATRRALSSLDAQEASSVSKNYRKNTSGQGDANGQGQMVMIGQTSGRNDPYTPAPSVPNGN
jgi:hypothetical protein